VNWTSGLLGHATIQTTGDIYVDYDEAAFAARLAGLSESQRHQRAAQPGVRPLTAQRARLGEVCACSHPVLESGSRKEEGWVTRMIDRPRREPVALFLPGASRAGRGRPPDVAGRALR